MEAKPVAAQIFELLGHHGGMIAYETAITTPAIFLGCHLMRRACRSGQLYGATHLACTNAERLLLFLIGVISLAAAVYNAQFLI